MLSTIGSRQLNADRFQRCRCWTLVTISYTTNCLIYSALGLTTTNCVPGLLSLLLGQRACGSGIPVPPSVCLFSLSPFRCHHVYSNLIKSTKIRVPVSQMNKDHDNRLHHPANNLPGPFHQPVFFCC